MPRRSSPSLLTTRPRAQALLLLVAGAAAAGLDSAAGAYGLDGSATAGFAAATPVDVGPAAAAAAGRGLLQDAPADMQGSGGSGGDALVQAVKAVLKVGGVPKFGDKGQRVFTSVAGIDELDLLRNWAVQARARARACLTGPAAPPYSLARAPPRATPAGSEAMSCRRHKDSASGMGSARPESRPPAAQARKSHIPHVSVIALDSELAAAAERMGLIVFSAPKLLSGTSDAKERSRVAKARRGGRPRGHARCVAALLCLRVAAALALRLTRLICLVVPPRCLQPAILSAIVAAGHDVLLSEPDVVRGRPATQLALRSPRSPPSPSAGAAEHCVPHSAASDSSLAPRSAHSGVDP